MLSADASGKSCKKMKVETMKNEKLQCVSEHDRDAPTGDIKYRSGAAREVRLDLQGSELWKSFHEIGTEMIITRAGRRMFPSVKVRNLDPDQQYSIAMDIMPVDSKRYRYMYHSSQWMVAGNMDHSCVPPRLCVHPDSPSSGQTWMRQIISFDHLKLTNNEMPRIHVIEHSPLETLVSLPVDGVCTFSFPETQFTTVTAYQNQQITKLKIDRNPFAKGFRERNGGVLHGMLESYSWHSPFDLDFKSLAMALQGRCYGAPESFGISSSVSSFSPAAHPVLFSSPQRCKMLPSNCSLTYRAYCSICLGNLSTYTGLRPELDLPFMTALQVQKADSCRGYWLQDSSSRRMDGPQETIKLRKTEHQPLCLPTATASTSLLLPVISDWLMLRVHDFLNQSLPLTPNMCSSEGTRTPIQHDLMSTPAYIYTETKM
uniref:T-box transcription factor 22 n=1 Tax=Cyprinus carpio TaxID=7962 RepID=A0A8C1NYF5_CYPCA